MVVVVGATLGEVFVSIVIQESFPIFTCGSKAPRPTYLVEVMLYTDWWYAKYVVDTYDYMMVADIS